MLFRSEQATKQGLQQLSKQPNGLATEQASGQTSEQSTEQPIELARKRATEQHKEQASGQAGRYSWLPLNEKQGKILLYLYDYGQGLTNMDIIVAETIVAYGTARKAIDVLVKEGYIINKQQHNGHAFRGFEYTLNNHLCSLYVTRIKEEQATEQASRQPQWQQNKQATERASGQANKQANGPISSRFLEKDLEPTTSKTGVLEDPELRFWRGEGVTEKQVQTWMNEFQMSQDEIVISLRYGRFDILEKGDTVQNPANWFYKIMCKNGFYPRPANYRSLAEIRAEALEQDLSREKEIKQRLAVAEAERAFQSIFSDPECTEYKELFGRVNGFAQEEGGIALETAMREAFLERK